MNVKKMRKTVIAALLSLAAVSAAVSAAEKTITVAGVVESYSAANHAFTVRTDAGESVSLVWTKETKFNGVVSQGARVTVRYTAKDGGNVAQTVGVLK